jgi:hypothetical protein
MSLRIVATSFKARFTKGADVQAISTIVAGAFFDRYGRWALRCSRSARRNRNPPSRSSDVNASELSCSRRTRAA